MILVQLLFYITFLFFMMKMKKQLKPIILIIKEYKTRAQKKSKSLQCDGIDELTASTAALFLSS